MILDISLPGALRVTRHMYWQDSIIVSAARQHGCDRQGVPLGKAARMEARAFVSCCLGWLSPGEQPQVLDPAEGLLWSANARVVGGDAARLIGDDGLDRGARAAQIHADLRAAPRPLEPLASLRIQLDDRAVFLERWRSLLGPVIERADAQGDTSLAS